MRPVRARDTITLLRRGLLGLASLTAAGTAVELAMERHWTQPEQLIPWGALVLVALAIGLLVGHPSTGRVRLAQLLAVIVVLVAAVGITAHVRANYEAGPLDYRYSASWDALSPGRKWWLASTRGVGPSPPLAPGAIAQAGLAVLLATARFATARGMGELESNPGEP